MLMGWASAYNHLPSSHFTFWTEMDAPSTEMGWKLGLQHPLLCNESECLAVFRSQLGFYFWWAMIGQVYQFRMHTLMLMRQISHAKIKSWNFHTSVLKCTIKNKVVFKNSASPQSSSIIFDPIFFGIVGKNVSLMPNRSHSEFLRYWELLSDF